MKKLSRFLFKLTLLIVNILFNNKMFYKLLGLINKKISLIKTVFVAYPANQEYTNAYYFSFYAKKIKWFPAIAGIFQQGKSIGLMFGITAVEADFNNKDFGGNVRDLFSRVEDIRVTIGALQKNFAGVLPGVFFGRRFLREAPEADTTVEAIIKAETLVREKMGYGKVLVIVLGGRGFVGRKLVKKMQELYIDREILVIDKNEDQHRNEENWHVRLKNQKAIVINITRDTALLHYIDLFWPELILLNEVYPEPCYRELALLKEKNIVAFHIAGVAARSFPSFPKAYHGGIPCCAAINNDSMKVIIKKLT